MARLCDGEYVGEVRADALALELLGGADARPCGRQCDDDAAVEAVAGVEADDAARAVG